MQHRNIIVAGASAGGVEALMQLVSRLPADLPAAIFVVTHIPAHTVSYLPSILERAGRLPAAYAVDGSPIQHGHIYTAPPNHHVVISRGHMHLQRSPKENGFRPAIDPLFRSAARAYGSQVIGIILSGLLDDGTAGLLAIKQYGGVAIVQNPADALYSSMPESAIEYVDVDYVEPVEAIPDRLEQLVGEGILTGEVMTRDEQQSQQPGKEGNVRQDHAAAPAGQQHYSCPDCGGVLSEFYENQMLRFRCVVGHTFSPQSAANDHAQTVDRALWSALNMLEERACLMRRLEEDAAGRGNPAAARRFSRQVHEVELQLQRMRALLADHSLEQLAQEQQHTMSQGHASDRDADQTIEQYPGT